MPTYGVSLLQPQRPVGGMAADPLGFMRTMAETQGLLQRNYQQQQVIQGQQMFGQIMAGPGTIQDKITAASQNPNVAPYLSEQIRAYQANEQTLAQIKQINLNMGGEVFRQNRSALEAVGSSLAPLLNESNPTPQMFDQLVGRQTALMPDYMKQNAAASIGNLRSYLFDGNPDAAEFHNRLAGLALGSGWTPENLYNLTGTIPPRVQTVVDPVTGIGHPVTVGGLYQPPAPSAGGAGGGGAAGPTSPPPAAPSTAGQADAGQAGPQGLVGQPGVEGAPGPSPGGITQTPGTIPVRPMNALPATAPAGQQDIQTKLNDAAAAIPRVANLMNVIQDQLEQFPAGRGTEARNQLASAAERAGSVLGLNPDMVKSWGEQIRGGKEAPQDIYTSLLGGYAIAQLKEAMSGTGRAMLPEVRYFMEHLSPETNPVAVWRMLNNARGLMQRQFDAQLKWPDFLNAVYNRQGPLANRVRPTDSPLNYAGWYSSQNFTDLPTRAEAYDLAPRDESRIFHQPPPTAGGGPNRFNFAPPPQ